MASTCHDTFVERDYRRLAARGIYTCRDGVRWHLIEKAPGQYDFSSVVPMLHAARKTGMQVIWDLCHYGWPDGIDIFSAEWIHRFRKFSAATARVIGQETEGAAYFCPINEISFFSWAAADVGIFAPFEKNRGCELKKQLVRATIESIEAVRNEVPTARIVHVDPVINVVTDPGTSPIARAAARAHCNAQYEAWDMLSGRITPELGGSPKYLDIIGCNYYVHNQWVHGGPPIERTDRRYRPLWRLLKDVWERYRRPLFLAETGIEDERRPEWLRYVCDEVATAILTGIPVEGICLYPIVNHPGWADDRHCHNGMWDYCNETGHREIYTPLADELSLQQARFADLLVCSAAAVQRTGTFV